MEFIELPDPREYGGGPGWGTPVLSPLYGGGEKLTESGIITVGGDVLFGSPSI